MSNKKNANDSSCKPREPWNLLAILGFVFTLIPIVPLVGLVLCLIGRAQCKRTGARGKGLATAGVVFNLLTLGIALAIILVGIFSGFAVAH